MVTTPALITMLPDREQVFTMTYDEWQALVAEHAHSEWVNGEAIVFMSPKEKHQAVLNLLSFLITGFVDLFSLGIVRFAPYEMRAVPDGPAREPDLLFIARDHLVHRHAEARKALHLLIDGRQPLFVATSKDDLSYSQGVVRSNERAAGRSIVGVEIVDDPATQQLDSRRRCLDWSAGH